MIDVYLNMHISTHNPYPVYINIFESFHSDKRGSGSSDVNIHIYTQHVKTHKNSYKYTQTHSYIPYHSQTYLWVCL
jgi:hypothetical protein